MRYVIASDIHGSAFYCRKLIDAYWREKGERLILLGDILYHGPRNELPEGHDPKGVAEMLNGIAAEILCVRGNCDAEVDQMVLKFPVLADYAIINSKNRLIYLTHGHHMEDHKLPVKPGDAVFFGHTHIPTIREKEGIVYINPGSVSLPKNGSQGGYIVLDQNEITFKTLDGREYDRYKLK